MSEDYPEIGELSVETRLWKYCVKTKGYWWNYIFPTHKITDLYEKLLRYPSIVARNTVRWKDHEAAVSVYNYAKRERAKKRKALRAREAYKARVAKKRVKALTTTPRYLMKRGNKKKKAKKKR